MALKINTLLSSRLTQWVVYIFIRIYSATLRLDVQNEGAWLDAYLKKGERILLCAHHQQFFAAIGYFQKYKGYKPGLMISQSKDGEFISGVAHKTGWSTVRGSSSRGGREALKAMIAHLIEHRLGAHIIDGPRGPFGGVKPGAIKLAQSADAMVVPFYIGADRAWYARSWDRFLIPKPFSRVVLRFEKGLRFKPTDTHEAFEDQRRELERLMMATNTSFQAQFSPGEGI